MIILHDLIDQMPADERLIEAYGLQITLGVLSGYMCCRLWISIYKDIRLWWLRRQIKKLEQQL